MDMQEWFPEKHPEYGNLETQCAAKLTELLAGGAALAEAFMRDTRAVHGQLYASLTPSGCGEYAGNYRGTAGTSLEKRVVGADGSVFSNPKQVKKHLDDQLSKLIDKVFESRNKKPEDAFNDAAMVFYFLEEYILTWTEMGTSSGSFLLLLSHSIAKLSWIRLGQSTHAHTVSRCRRRSRKGKAQYSPL